MINLSRKLKSSNDISDATSELGMSAKLRRLKIQESVLVQNIISLNPLICDKNLHNSSDSNISSDFKTFLMKKKHTLSEVKKLFQDLKTCVCSQTTLKSIDIDDIKTSVLELDNRIKTLKMSLQSELLVLKASEKQLNNEINEVPREIHTAKKIYKNSKNKYNDIVPSPVKLLMDSPFKSVEVQEYQDFMKQSRNRYGGWDEYNHNIFQNFWQSYVGCGYEIDPENIESKFPYLDAFVEELFPKLHGISRHDIKFHVQWYMKYLFLRNRQQNAIEKWRSNREVIKKTCKIPTQNEKEESKLSSKKYKSIVADTLYEINDIMGSSIESEISNTDNHSKIVRTKNTNNSHYLKPTKQWNYKLNDINSNSKCYNMNLDQIKTLGRPSWRAEL